MSFNEIDEVLKSFASSTAVSSGDPGSASSDPVRWCQYKARGLDSSSKEKAEGQVERREKVLREQNRLRDAKLAKLRQKTTEGDDAADQRPSPSRFRLRRRSGESDLLRPMMSEWMLTVPDDLTANWLVLLCPTGRRNMVVATGGSTFVYSKAGKQVMHFSSLLPAGGCDNRSNLADSVTVIDCIFSQADLTFYVLDLLTWKGTNLADTDTECRQFFLRSRFDENADLSNNGVHNSGYRFKLVPLIENCDAAVLSQTLAEQPPSPVIDGLLFYHRHCTYTHGITPTVLWLRPFMLSTTFGEKAIIAGDKTGKIDDESKMK